MSSEPKEQIIKDPNRNLVKFFLILYEADKRRKEQKALDEKENNNDSENSSTRK